MYIIEMYRWKNYINTFVCFRFSDGKTNKVAFQWTCFKSVSLHIIMCVPCDYSASTGELANSRNPDQRTIGYMLVSVFLLVLTTISFTSSIMVMNLQQKKVNYQSINLIFIFTNTSLPSLQVRSEFHNLFLTVCFIKVSASYAYCK